MIKVVISDRAVILRIQAFRETSLFVTWMTEHHGLLRTCAQGAKRPKSPFYGKLDLYFQCQISWKTSNTSDLHSLKEIELNHPRIQLRESWQKLQTAAWFSHLILKTHEPDCPAKNVFHLLSLAFDYLDKLAPSALLVQRFERRLAIELGLSEKHSPLNTLENTFSLQRKHRPSNIT